MDHGIGGACIHVCKRTSGWGSMNERRKNSARAMMELAVATMRQSVPEHRPDGTPSPKVGAVLIRSDGSALTAARGELREGDHAEYTLLERKCANERLDGCTLYTTLEPCLERNPPKRGCARRIVNARIKKVYVGIIDDNPKVARKGIAYLEQRGVEVQMFDRDLQDLILKENEPFFLWARQQTGRPKTEPIKLSRFEDAVTAGLLRDLDPAALEHYRNRAGLTETIDSAEFKRLLFAQGLVNGTSKAAKPTGFGMLLFGRKPRGFMPQAGLLARAELADGSDNRKEFDRALVLIPDELEKWLDTVLPSTLDRSRIARTEKVNLPFVMLREAVINALIHRDYDIEGQKCQLVVTGDTITVRSPGAPIAPITLEQMQHFTAPMKSRNPVLHHMFARMGYAEEQGFGLKNSLKKEAETLGLPLPGFAMDGDCLVLTIYRSKAGAVSGLSPAVRRGLNKDDLAAWELASGLATVGSADLKRVLDVDERKAQRILKRLRSAELLRQVGRGRSTRYEVLRP